MHRCLVQLENWAKEPMPVGPDEAHRLLHVLRLKSGDRVSVFDGTGNDAVACVEVGEDGTAFLRREQSFERSFSGVELTLIQAVPKGRRMDLLVEKCTELGVRSIEPVLTERGVVRPEEGGAEARVARWRRIAESAARQCGVSVVPRIGSVRKLTDVLSEEMDRSVLFLVGSLQHNARSLAAVLGEVRTREPGRIRILIGPEGDLTDAELGLACSRGAIPVTFGPRVLRVETAAIFAAAVVAYEFSSDVGE